MELSEKYEQPVWMAAAACLDADPEGSTFFPTRGKRTIDAKQICDGCRVRDACKQYAVDEQIEYGVWGGEYFSPRNGK